MKILVVEEDPLSQQIHIQYLKKLCCQVTQATHAQLRNVNISKFDGVFIDLPLAHERDFKILATLQHQNEKRIPLIIVTAYVSESIQRAALAQGAYAVLIKPALIDDFEKVLQKMQNNNI